MGRIKNKILYPDDPNLSLDDFLVGSNKENNGKTQSYPLRSIVGLIDGAIITSVGNESEEGIEDGWDLVAEGKPIVAEYDSLEFEYNSDMDVVLLKSVFPPLADVRFRSGGLNVNSDESAFKWARIYVDEGEDESQDVTIIVPKLEVSISNFEQYSSPRLVIERYRPKRYKGFRDSINNLDRQYTRASFKKEVPVFGATLKPNDIPLTSSTQVIDIGAEKYFRVLRSAEGDTTTLYRTGTGAARRSAKTRKNISPLTGDVPRTKCLIKVHIESLVKGEYKKVSQDYYLNLSIVGKEFPAGAVINIEHFIDYTYTRVRTTYPTIP